jgi:hypothetical protein
MTANRQRYAWIWVAVAAVAMTTIAHAQADLPRSAALRAALTNPVLQFLSAHAHQDDTAAAWARRGASAHTQRSSSQQANGAWMVFLPVFFIGLVAPLSLLSPGALLSPGRSASSPFRPFLFQRPPPSFRF